MKHITENRYSLKITGHDFNQMLDVMRALKKKYLNTKGECKLLGAHVDWKRRRLKQLNTTNSEVN